MKALIYTEGSKKIGFGHITRCISMYQAFESRNITPCFVVNGDKTVRDLLSGRNYTITDWTKKVSYPVTDIAVIDSYLASAANYSNIAKSAKLLVNIDDNIRMSYPGGLVVNGTVFSEKFRYKRNTDIKYLLGSKYMPLRKAFWDIKQARKIRHLPSKIMITFGGEDPRRMTPAILSFLVKNFGNMEKSVVVGKGFTTAPLIRKLADKKTALYFNQDAEAMKRIMLDSDLAVSAGGQTIYELARTGTPTIVVPVAENQRNNVAGWVKAGFVLNAGSFDDKALFENLTGCMEKLESASVRKNMSAAGKRLIDGKGSERVVREIQRALKSCK